MARRARPVWTFDCETDPFITREECERRGIAYPREPRPFLFGLYEGEREEYREFREIEAVIGFFQSEYSSKEKPIVYAHNGGKFADYHSLRGAINSDENIMVISGRLAKFRIGECEFRDSLNILPVGLKAFEKEEIDYAIMEPEVRWEAKNHETISRYLRSDCVNLYNFVSAYIKRFGRGLTQAGAAMRYWSKTSDIRVPKQSAANFTRLKPFYYGGRVQCFRSGVGECDFKVVDINSAYPRAMLEEHPFSTASIISTDLPSKGIEQCLIRLRARSDGCFPYREDDGSLSFPQDGIEREYFVTGWEYQAAIDERAAQISDIIEVHRFSETINFKDYVKEFYEERKRAKAAKDKAADIFAKIFLNGLYGKFASDVLNYREWLIATDDSIFRHGANGYTVRDAWDERYLLCRDIPKEKHRYYNIATAASITGYVRAFLFRSLRQCRGLIYCDTDSIAAENLGKLQMGGELGQWKLEKECLLYAVAGKKLYAFLGTDCTWKIASKGIDADAFNVIDAAMGKTVIFYPKVPTYSILRQNPIFTPRTVKNTAKLLH